MTPSLFQLNNFHTPFPISSLPAGDSKCGCVPRPKQQQNVRWLTTVCQSGHSADQTGTSATLCPNRFCPNVSVLSEPVLSADHIMFAGLLPPTMFCREMFCPPSWFYPPCPPPLRVGGNRKSRGNILAARLRELILRFLRACFWAFIFRAPGRWTELWSRLGQARCVGVMAALPLAPPLHNPACCWLVHGRTLYVVPHHHHHPITLQ